MLSIYIMVQKMWLKIVLGKDFARHTLKLHESKSEGWEGVHNTAESCQVSAIPFPKSLLGDVSNTWIHKTPSYQVWSTVTVLGNLHSPSHLTYTNKTVLSDATMNSDKKKAFS